MPTIEFNDGTPVTMSCIAPRFANWQPQNVMVGPARPSLGTGVTTKYTFRTDYCATFDFPYIANNDLSKVLRFAMHIESGSTFRIRTGDASNTQYTCYMWPGRRPELSYADKTNMEYTLTVYAKNTGSAHMTVTY